MDCINGNNQSLDQHHIDKLKAFEKNIRKLLIFYNVCGS
jgi:hypothetical protein